MCVKLVAAVFKCELPSTAKFVLVSLADQANPKNKNRCWPSVEFIACRTGFSVRTVQTALKLLEDSGHITRHYKTRLSTNYHIHPRLGEDPEATTTVQEIPGKPADCDTEPRSSCGVIIKNPKLNHQISGSKFSRDEHQSIAREADKERKFMAMQVGELAKKVMEAAANKAGA